MVKNKIIFFFFLSAILQLSGCVNREDDIVPDCQSGCVTINGYITTGTGTEPLSNANIAVYWINTQYLSGGTVRKKAVTTSDTYGYYELDFPLREEELEEGFFDVKILIDTVEFLKCGKSNHNVGINELERDTVIGINYFIPRKAFVELVIANQEQIQTDDYFANSLTSRFGVDGRQRCGQYVAWGDRLSSNIKVEVAAEQPVIIEISKTKEGIRTVSYDTLSLTAGEKEIYTTEF